MQVYPVHYSVTPPASFTRVQLAARLVAFVGLGMIGVSFGAVFCFAYVALPAVAASWIASSGSEHYAREAGPRIRAALRWFAAVSAWIGLVADRIPTSSADDNVRVEIDGEVRPTAGDVLVRVITGIPSALVLAVLGAVGVVVWLWAAISILVHERVPAAAHQYLTGVQRWSVRLLAYQAGLVDAYPPFSFEDAPLATPSPTSTAGSMP